MVYMLSIENLVRAFRHLVCFLSKFYFIVLIFGIIYSSLLRRLNHVFFCSSFHWRILGFSFLYEHKCELGPKLSWSCAPKIGECAPGLWNCKSQRQSNLIKWCVFFNDEINHYQITGGGTHDERPGLPVVNKKMVPSEPQINSKTTFALPMPIH